MNRICKLFGIKYPVIQGGMVWCSGWKLASAVSNAGGLGLLGAGSMNAALLEKHIRKTFAATQKPFGVNVPLLYHGTDEIMEVIIRNKVPVVFTSAGSPAKWTSRLKERGITVAHVVSGSVYAEKCEAAGVDAIVAEGFEAGGHNGREETTTMALIPSVRKVTDLPLLAAGGIASGEAMLAAMILGADGVQAGSLFAVSQESSAHDNFKKFVVGLKEGETKLMMKKLAPSRLAVNDFSNRIESAESEGKPAKELLRISGRGRTKSGVFEGDTENGALTIGQVSAQLTDILSVDDIMRCLVSDYHNAKRIIAENEKFEF